MASRSIVTLELDDQTWSWIREQAQRWRISPETALAVVVEQQFSAENRDQPRRWPDLNDRQAAASDESAGKAHQVAQIQRRGTPPKGFIRTVNGSQRRHSNEP